MAQTSLTKPEGLPVDTAILLATISTATALAVAALTYALNKRRDRETEWRGLKLQHYKEYVAALSGVVGQRSTPAAQARYSDAVNSMVLVAPPEVLRALYAFQDEVSFSNPRPSKATHDAALSALMREVRRDVQPRVPRDEGIIFRLMDSLPADATGRTRGASASERNDGSGELPSEPSGPAHRLTSSTELRRQSV